VHPNKNNNDRKVAFLVINCLINLLSKQPISQAFELRDCARNQSDYGVKTSVDDSSHSVGDKKNPSARYGTAGSARLASTQIPFRAPPINPLNTRGEDVRYMNFAILGAITDNVLLGEFISPMRNSEALFTQVRKVQPLPWIS
jgi:hypothetical protein